MRGIIEEFLNTENTENPEKCGDSQRVESSQVESSRVVSG